MQLLYNLSLPVAGISSVFITLFLFRFLDRLIGERRKRCRFLRIGLSLVNGGISAYVLSLYNGGAPTIFLILFLDIVYIMEYTFIGKDKQSTYHFLGSAVFFNNLMVYMMTYSIYRCLPLNRLDIAGEVYQRLSFILTNIGCLNLFMLFQIKAFPTTEIREVIHSNEARFLKIWLSSSSGVLALYSIVILPMVQSETVNRRIEIGLYSAVFLWAFSCMISSYAIILYQAFRVKVRNTLQGQLNEEQTQKVELKEQADRQPLTGLLNRRAWEREVKEAVAAGKNGCLVMLDLDHFKEVNDNLGHPEGDRILKETADMLRESFREIDIIGHIGGDEFCVFLVGNFEKEIVERRLESLMDLRRKEFPSKNGGTFCLSMSAGYAEVPNQGEVHDKFVEMVARADAALYWQKEHGRNGFVMFRENMSLEIENVGEREIQEQ